jgi:hypothetical protein
LPVQLLRNSHTLLSGVKKFSFTVSIFLAGIRPNSVSECDLHIIQVTAVTVCDRLCLKAYGKFSYFRRFW